ncbi:acetylcholinesterase-1-like [Dermacentor albipictus]|uniref:acetylcholinesterase-1-like n=1 Tax=Dermacentor albipictus TaxID=60249 RepID=UPI0038FC394E
MVMPANSVLALLLTLTCLCCAWTQETGGAVLLEEGESPVVRISAGKLRGAKRPALDDKYVYAFTGVPYARPPVGELRYQKPEPAAPWAEEVRDATRTPPSCMQLNVASPRNLVWVPYDQPKSEDCLYLNVWTPKLNASVGLPVMAWLHGGGFQSGSAAMPLDDGTHLAALGDVVVVTIAYRLLSFGFLYDETPAAPGNMGLHDQQLALKWIQENVAAFGGDPAEVTLFGWSAGGISTGFHLLSPGSKSLFKRAIIQSAGVTKKGRAKDKSEMLNYSRKFAASFGCYHEDSAANTSQSIAACMKKINATLLTSAEPTFVGGIFEPIFGDEFLPVEPRIAEFPGDKDVIIGQTANEGTNQIYIEFRDTFSEALPPRQINKAEMVHFLSSLYNKLSLSEIEKLQEGYMGDIGDFDYDALRQALAETKGDSHVTCGALNTACKLANATAEAQSGKGVRYYEMNYVSACPNKLPWFGMTHGDDLPQVFGRAFDKQGGCADDISYSRRIMQMWSDFAHGRSLSGSGGADWPKFTSDSTSYLKLTATGTEVSTFNNGERCKTLKELKLY